MVSVVIVYINIFVLLKMLRIGQWMCAGGENKDACQGFGGAPLVFRENGLFKQVDKIEF